MGGRAIASRQRSSAARTEAPLSRWTVHPFLRRAGEASPRGRPPKAGGGYCSGLEDLTARLLLDHGQGTRSCANGATTLCPYAEDRIDGRFGVVYLVLGFSVQAVGYVLELGFDTSTDPSASRALAALALAVVVGVSAYAVWERKRPGQVKRTLVEMAHYDTSSAFGPPVRRDGPYLGLLFAWGRAAGYPMGDKDSERSYAERVFGVTNGWPTGPGASHCELVDVWWTEPSGATHRPTTEPPP